MRLSKTAWWILGIGFFLLATIVLVTLFSRQSSEAGRMEESLSLTQGLLVTLTADKEDMTNQLAQLENELDAAQLAFNKGKAKFPRTVSSIEYDEELFSIADDYHLEVLSLTASEPRNIEVGDVIFSGTYFEVEVQGNISYILAYLNNIATGGYFDAATVELVRIEGPETGQTELPTAVIKIVVYSYEGG
jgi:hypothetical protein